MKNEKANNIKYLSNNLELLRRIKKYRTRKFYEKVATMMTSEERKNIVDRLEHKSCYNCQFASCSVLPVVYEMDINCTGWINYEIIGKARVLKNHYIDNL